MYIKNINQTVISYHKEIKEKIKLDIEKDMYNINYNIEMKQKLF